jgi:hypothetical protein
MPAMNESLFALHSALVDALLQRHQHSPQQPVTVAEIYQDLVPYRIVRTTAGFALNADYEHALLRLLAGDGGFARVEPVEVQNELQSELKSANPNVGIFRRYAACDVFITLPSDFETRRGRPAAAAQPGLSALRDAAAVPVARSAPAAAPAQRPASAPAGPARATPAASQSVSGARGLNQAPATTPVANGAAACSACKTPLPSGRAARFCPFCGHDQSRSTCARCREPLEPAWKYCVTCGTPV